MLKDYCYTLYICKYHHKITEDKIESMLEHFKDSPFLFRQDITADSFSEQVKYLDRIISAERVRRFRDSKMPYSINLFKAFDGVYIMLLSVCEEKIDEATYKNLLNCLFKSRAQTSISLYGNDKATLLESADYWKGVFASIRTILPIRKRELSDYYYAESFEIDDDIKAAITECISQGEKSFKTIFNMALCRIVCEDAQIPKILLNDVHDGGRLRNAPIFFDNRLEADEQYNSIKKQFIKAEYYDMCTDKMLRDSINFNIDNVPMITSYYMYDGKFKYFIEHLREGAVYSIEAIDANNVGLEVEFSIVDNEYAISYIYNERMFKDVDIKSLHDKLLGMLRVILNVDSSKTIEEDNKQEPIEAIERADSIDKQQSDSAASASVKENQSEDVNTLRRNQLKLSCIDKIELFSSLNQEKRTKLIDKCEFIVIPNVRHFISPGANIDSLYFIVSGKMTVMGINSAKYICPLYTLGSGQVFGIESMLLNNISNVGYSAFDDKTVILKVDAEMVRQLARDDSSIYIKLLTEMENRLYRVERLWMTV